MKNNIFFKNSVALLAVSVFILSLSFFTSCSNNSNEEDMTSNLSAKLEKSNMCEISLSEIPTGITPYVVKNDKELSELINKIMNTQAVVSSPLTTDSVINNRSLKAPAFYSSSESYGVYQIYYSVRYDNEHKNDYITVSSGISGLHPMIEWRVNTQGGRWEGQYVVNWWVNGTLCLYVNVDGKYDLITQSKYYGGRISIPPPPPPINLN